MHWGTWKGYIMLIHIVTKIETGYPKQTTNHSIFVYVKSSQWSTKLRRTNGVVMKRRHFWVSMPQIRRNKTEPTREKIYQTSRCRRLRWERSVTIIRRQIRLPGKISSLEVTMLHQRPKRLVVSSSFGSPKQLNWNVTHRDILKLNLIDSAVCLFPYF